MKPITNLMKSGLLALVVACSGTVAAAPTIFFGEDLAPGATVPAGGAAATARASFLSNLVGVGNENFESFSNLTSIAAGIGIAFPGSTGNITATLTGSPPFPGGICNQTIGGTVGSIGCGFDRFATSGNNYLQTQIMSIVFSQAISAFGFYGTDFGDFSGVISLTLSGGATETIAVNTTQGSSAGGNLIFWGFVDPSVSYSRIDFVSSTGADVFGFDDMVIGDRGQVITSVPEPGTLALSALALLALGLRRRSSK